MQDNTTLNAILQNVTDHRDHSLELTMNNDFHGIGFDGLTIALLWGLALWWCLRNAKLLAAGIATLGIFAAILNLTDWITITSIALFIIALWLESFARERIYQRFTNDRNTE